MRDEVETFRKLCQSLLQHRRICTGEAMDISRVETWTHWVDTKDDFGALVSEAYILWRETWELDIGFLLSLRRADGPARDFGDLIYQLRTARQHTDNQEAMARSDEWAKKTCGGHIPAAEDDWAACGRALMVELNNAIGCLCRLAAYVQRDATFRQAWQAKVSKSVSAVVSSVALDLGMSLHPKQRDHYAREVRRLWTRYRLRRGENASDVLASLAERCLAAVMDRLPCDYHLILDELQVLGTANALPAVHLAHAVAEITGASGEAYVNLVKSAWTDLRQATAP